MIRVYLNFSINVEKFHGIPGKNSWLHAIFLSFFLITVFLVIKQRIIILKTDLFIYFSAYFSNKSIEYQKTYGEI